MLVRFAQSLFGKPLLGQSDCLASRRADRTSSRTCINLINDTVIALEIAFLRDRHNGSDCQSIEEVVLRTALTQRSTERSRRSQRFAIAHGNSRSRIAVNRALGATG
jgi:hypothetical protein